MTSNISESKRMELICEFIKSGKQPEGFKITETKNGRYRLSRVKSDKEALEAKRKCYQKKLDEIEDELKKLDNQEKQDVVEPQEDKPVDETQ